jgi:hypothetical protein
MITYQSVFFSSFVITVDSMMVVSWKVNRKWIL